MKAPVPPNEEERLKALRSYEILDTPPEKAFDALAQLAAELCGAPVATVTLVDESRQWFKARVGWEVKGGPRDEAICAHTLLSPDLLVVPDTTEDQRFSDNPDVVGGERIRFYAGAPLVGPEGIVLGALCVIDRQPRMLTEFQKKALVVLAEQVVGQLELRRHVKVKTRNESALLGILEDQQLAERALRKSEREQRELALRLEEERARLVKSQAVARVGSWETDLMTFGAIWSEETFRILEVDRARFTPSHQEFWEKVHPEDRAEVDAAFLRSVNAKQPVGNIIEHRLLLDDGRIKYVEEIWQIAFDADGRAIRAVGTCQDITDRKLAEVRQRTLSHRLSDTIESIADAFYTLDQEWRFTYVNREAERLLRRERDGLLGRELWVEFPEIVGTHFEQQLRYSAKERLTVQFEELYRPFQKWLELRCFPSESGVAVYVRDVTRRRIIDDQLRLLEGSIARINDIVIITRALPVEEPGPEIVFVNDAFERVTGYSREEALGRSPRFLQGPKTSRDALNRIRQAITAGKPVQEELINYTKDGQEYWIDINISPVSDSSGCITHLVSVQRDITERKKLEDQFLRAQRMESIGTLAGGIAHDLNNLLSPIIMGADFVRQFETREEILMVLDNIHRSANRGADLVKQVLSFARGVRGARVSVHIDQIVGEIESIIGNTFPKNISFQNDVPRNLWVITGDPTQINQVLLNLCVNARDAMPDGGKLSISGANVEIDAQYAVMNRGVAAGRYVVIAVTDTGTGMSKEVSDRIFEPFFTTKAVGSGTGLGLSTVLGILRSHGGFVNVYSEPNRGSVFKIYLPAQTADLGAPHMQLAPESLPRGHGQLVLVVDDESSIRMVTKQTLEAFGYRVETADDGAQAIAIFAQMKGEIALVMTDMMMPIMDGAALINAVRRLDPEIPIIAASGLNTNENIAKASAAGVRHFLSKPYTTETLLKLIATVVAQQGAT